MKKLYYLVAAAMVAGAMFFFGTNRSEASSVVDELQRSNLEALSSRSYYIDTNCFDVSSTGNPKDRIVHICQNKTIDGKKVCHVGYNNQPLPLIYIPCRLLPIE